MLTEFYMKKKHHTDNKELNFLFLFLKRMDFCDSVKKDYNCDRDYRKWMDETEENTTSSGQINSSFKCWNGCWSVVIVPPPLKDLQLQQ